MTQFALHIFPESSLASSLITTVWIGVFVTCFFNLRFGWSKSGLIIPGYLVPLLILKPWSAVAVIIEGLITYLIIKFISEFGSFSKMWSNYFGRDRFFLIFLIAIAVRILFDEILFPQLTILLGDYFNIDFVYKGGLYSVGLVIVALTANHFWNSGLKRGFPHLIIVLLCTFLIIKYILIPYTNFRLNNIVYLYEDIATSIAASPKAYIILTVTAFIASRMNLLYGWEFSGIIIPALLALQWYFPSKIATSLIEAGIIYGIATIILKSRFFLNSTIEGARKILLFFNIAFIYKIFLGFILPLIYSDAPISDTYGLGYMLTSLIAIKMYDKKIGLKMTRSILQVSVVSVIIATLIGFSLLFVPNTFNSNDKILSLKDTPPPKVLHTNNKTLTEIISSQQVKLYGNTTASSELTGKELNSFETGLLALKYYANTQSNSSLNYAVKNLDKAAFKVRIINNKYILLTEKHWKRSRGIYVISMTDDADDSIISVPYPIGHPALITSAVSIFEKSNARALAISNGVEKLPGDILKEDKTIFSEFIRFFSYENSVTTLIKQNKNNFNLLKNSKLDKTYIILPKPIEQDDLNLNFNELFGDTEKVIKPEIFTDYRNLNNSSVLLYLSTNSLIHQLSNIDKYKNLASNSVNKILESFDKVFNIKKSSKKSIFSYISSMFHTQKKTKYYKSILSNQKADFIDKNILSGLVNLSLKDNNLKSKYFISQIKLIDFAANDMEYSLSLYTFKSGKPDYIVLNKKSNSKKKKLEGAYFFRVTNSNPYILQVFDLNKAESLQIANMLSHKFNPSVIMFAISPTLDVDLTELTDITMPSSSTFNLVSQVAMRNTDAYYDNKPSNKQKDTTAPITLQIRFLKNSKHIKYKKNTLYIATYLGKYKFSQLSKQEKIIYNYFKELGLNIKFIHAASIKTAGLEAAKLEQGKYTQFTQNFNFMVLWFSPDIDTFSKEKKSIKKTEKKQEKNVDSNKKQNSKDITAKKKKTTEEDTKKNKS